jgi:cytoskeletal protein RodZ
MERADDKEREARSMEQSGTLAQLLSQGLEQRGMTVETVSDRTKVPRSTLRVLLGATDPAILPQRIYLRGHVGVIAKDLGLDPVDAYARFDRENPTESKIEAAVVEPRFSKASMAGVAALGGIGIIAVILAFVH